MRHLKMLGLAVVAGLAAMAFVGASSASANIDICEFELPLTEEITNLTGCPTGYKNLLTTLLFFEAKATGPVLKGTIKEVCDESNTRVMNKGDGTLNGEVEWLSFTGNCSPCSTVTTEGLPYNGKINMEGSEYYLESAGQAKLSGCTFGVTCKFGTSGVKLKFVYGEHMAHNEFRAEEEVLTLLEGSKFLCGATGKWTANYVVESPLHFWLHLL